MTAIAPMLSVRNGVRAIEFYKAAFGAGELFRLDSDSGAVVARLFRQADQRGEGRPPESIGSLIERTKWLPFPLALSATARASASALAG